MQYRMNTQEKNGKVMRMDATFEFQPGLVADLVHAYLCGSGDKFSSGVFTLDGTTIRAALYSSYDYEGLQEQAVKSFTEKAEAFAKEAAEKERDVAPIARQIHGARLEISALGNNMDNAVQRKEKGLQALDDRVYFIESGDGGDGLSLPFLNKRFSAIEKRVATVEKKLSRKRGK